MTCKEAQSLVIPFVRHQMDDEKMEEFLEHIESCKNCAEELEIYYMVEAGIRQLDSDGEDYDIKGDLERDLRSSRKRLAKVYGCSVARYAADTVMFLSVLVTFLLQLRIWWQQ